MDRSKLDTLSNIRKTAGAGGTAIHLLSKRYADQLMSLDSLIKELNVIKTKNVDFRVKPNQEICRKLFPEVTGPMTWLGVLLHGDLNSENYEEKYHFTVLSWLLDQGVDVNELVDGDDLALNYVLNFEYENRDDILELLLKKGADINKSNGRGPPLAMYINEGIGNKKPQEFISIVTWLIDNGANVQGKSENGYPPLAILKDMMVNTVYSMKRVRDNNEEEYDDKFDEFQNIATYQQLLEMIEDKLGPP